MTAVRLAVSSRLELLADLLRDEQRKVEQLKAENRALWSVNASLRLERDRLKEKGDPRVR